MTASDPGARVRTFLGSLCNLEGLGDEDDLFAGGFVNSLYLAQLLAFVQGEFDLELAEDDYDMANFRSLRAVADFVARKRGET